MKTLIENKNLKCHSYISILNTYTDGSMAKSHSFNESKSYVLKTITPKAAYARLQLSVLFFISYIKIQEMWKLIKSNIKQ